MVDQSNDRSQCRCRTAKLLETAGHTREGRNEQQAKHRACPRILGWRGPLASQPGAIVNLIDEAAASLT